MSNPSVPVKSPAPFVFPRWINSLRVVVAVVAIGAPVYAVLLLGYGASPRTTDVGYAPPQPVSYSHALHAGTLGIDCRYCHGSVETAAHAAVPPTQTCMNCHATIRTESLKLLIVRESYLTTGTPIEWVRVHDLPDYVYFNHSAHVRRGVGCVSCHGRVDQMEVVYQAEPLSMGWCLDCHRAPEAHLRPTEQVTNMEYAAEDQPAEGKRLRALYNINPSTDCSTCHR
ncbi:MAG TPA: cytochrome c3 family protein [Phycisphaerae bacterium]|nr:cytochrome c3 family protein [Phycisphaerae bacterium]HNU46525.1 cytochrome c3 family protein [Phycisphaerae bacterium]